MKETKTGILLINLGTPDAPTAEAVRPYLREFLMDPLVVDIPWVFRWLLVNLIIAPFRSPKSAEAYKSIWTDQGSPLKLNTQSVAEKLASSLPLDLEVEWAMRYGKPKTHEALKNLRARGVNHLRVIPLYPQYALSSTQSSLDEVKRALDEIKWDVKVEVLREFFVAPEYIEPLAQMVSEHNLKFRADHILMSYHGLPVRHVQKTAATDPHCGLRENCCDALRESNRWCYRAQSYATSRSLAERLKLKPGDYTVAFQSRLGRTEWIRPYTDEVLVKLASRGVRRLLVVCPSFVADCLETLEEIGIRAREDFIAQGGEDLRLVPCLNSHPDWVLGLSRMALKGAGEWSQFDPVDPGASKR